MHLASAARAACGMEKSVVANVLIPFASRKRHASRPSQVLGILMQTRDASKFESSALYIATMPMKEAVSVLYYRQRLKANEYLTLSIGNSLLFRI